MCMWRMIPARKGFSFDHTTSRMCVASLGVDEGGMVRKPWEHNASLPLASPFQSHSHSARHIYVLCTLDTHMHGVQTLVHANTPQYVHAMCNVQCLSSSCTFSTPLCTPLYVHVCSSHSNLHSEFIRSTPQWTQAQSSAHNVQCTISLFLLRLFICFQYVCTHLVRKPGWQSFSLWRQLSFRLPQV